MLDGSRDLINGLRDWIPRIHCMQDYSYLKLRNMASKDGEEPSTRASPKDSTLVNYHDDDQSSLSSSDDQVGVKNIEVVSQTWTKWSLIAAYAG